MEEIYLVFVYKFLFFTSSTKKTHFNEKLNYNNNKHNTEEATSVKKPPQWRYHLSKKQSNQIERLHKKNQP